jgi:hypothetical protein
MAIPDRHSAGRSRRVPYVYGEPAEKRHERRLLAALADEKRLLTWCTREGIEINIRNEGHHWTMTRGNLLAEWWPSSAKFVWCQQWADGVHIHDTVQLLRELKKRFVPPASPAQHQTEE